MIGPMSYKNFLLGCALFVISFLGGTLAWFPYTRLVNGWVAENLREKAGIEVSCTKAAYQFPLTWTVRGLLLSSKSRPELRQALSSAELTPRFSTFLGNPSAKVRLKFAEGTLESEISSRHFKTKADGIHLEKTFLAAALNPLQVSGTLRGEGEVTISDGKDNLDGEFKGTIRSVKVKHFRLSGLEFPELDLASLTGRILLTGSTLQFEEIKGKPGNLSLSGSGTLLLKRPFFSSRPNLTLKARFTPQFEEKIGGGAGLLKPLQDASGNITIRLGGTLGSPAWSF
ncbi:MAG: type II secretion system protein GspN [Candidatus Hydrogenedentota bacterium]|nr:MAG: type II secretion system protein GspN [Candidatus Hydrogenedentota bacterium]